MVKYLRNTPIQFDINANLIIQDRYWVGLSYRTGDGIVGMLEFQITKQFRVGYAYDQPLTLLRRYTAGSHELFLRYEFGYGLKAMSPRYF